MNKVIFKTNCFVRIFLVCLFKVDFIRLPLIVEETIKAEYLL